METEMGPEELLHTRHINGKRERIDIWIIYLVLT